MAKSNHKARARPVAVPRPARKPTNALGRPYWVLGLGSADAQLAPLLGTKHHLPATCATLTKGVRALAQILGNSEAFRALQEGCDGFDPSQAPFDVNLTDGLFAALFALSDQAEQACMDMLEASLAEHGVGDS
jgi:hypothetical protein